MKNKKFSLKQYESDKIKWEKIEDRLIDLIAECNNLELTKVFAEWLTMRNKLNSQFMSYVEALYKEENDGMPL